MFAKFFNLSLLVALVLPLSTLAAPFASNYKREDDATARNLTRRSTYTDTQWTYYIVADGNEVACGGYYQNTDSIVALSAVNFNPSFCGKTITMTYQGVTQTATIVDECPGCPPNGLDLSQSLFQGFADISVGVLSGDWSIEDGSPSPSPSTDNAPPAQSPPPNRSSDDTEDCDSD